MNTKIKYVVLGLCAVNLSSCVTYGDYYTTKYDSYTDDTRQYYSQVYSTDYNQLNNSYNTNTTYQYNDQPKQQVSVPDSYHVGAYHSPVSSKDVDKTWVVGQNPQSYTIEVADGDKASQVAQKLYKAPKNDRMAQVKYQRGGKSYYKGLYGTYKSAEEAQKALDALPADIKQGAGVKNWGSVQSNLNE